MSNFNHKSASLTNGYVYYKTYKNYYPQLGFYKEQEINRIARQTVKTSYNVDYLYDLAQQELNKERALLKKYFNIETNFVIGDLTSARDFIKALNSALGLKEVYDRNINLIKNSHAKNIMSWFPTYFNQQWGQRQDALPAEIVALSDRKDISLEDAAEEVISKAMEQATIEALRSMMQDADVEARVDKKHQQAYSDLLSAIGVFGTGGLAEEFRKIYRLDEIKEHLISDIKGRKTGFKANNKLKGIKTKVDKNIHQKGGIAAEVVRVYLSKIATQKNITVKNAPWGIVHTGNYRTKPDVVLTFGIDTSVVEQILEQESLRNRIENVAAYNKLGELMKNVDDGFIVYVSNKNYSLGDSFQKSRGFSTGTDLSAQQYYELFKNIENNIDTFIGALMQLGEGAIGNYYTDIFERTIAQNIAYLLFDDFQTIGEQQTKGQALHLMDLNGVLIPMSFILSALADAIQTEMRDGFRRVVDVSIDAPQIEFATMEEEENYVREHSPAGTMNYAVAWDYQKAQAMKNTRIASSFLLTFQELIKRAL